MRTLKSSLLILVSVGLLSGCGGKPDVQPIRRRTEDKPSIYVTQAQDNEKGDEDVESESDASRPAHPSHRPPTTPVVKSNELGKKNKQHKKTVKPEDFELLLPEGEERFAGETAVERRQRTIANMEKIAAATVAYFEENNVFPSTINSKNGRQLLSWRVSLLPYLGYQDLYNTFDKESPWNDPHNLELLKHVPPVFQSPDLMNEKSAYLAPERVQSILRQARRVSRRRIEDDIKNTALFFEVDSAWAMPWTAPADYVIDPRDPKAGLGNLREDGFFVAWGDGRINLIPENVGANLVFAMSTTDGGENFDRADVALPVSSDPIPEIARPTIPENDVVPGAAAKVNQAVARREERERENNRRQLHPIPPVEEQNKARNLLRQAYEEQYQNAKTRKEKRDFAHRLMRDSKSTSDNVTEQYVMLTVALTVSKDAADAGLTLDIAEELIENFDVNRFTILLDAVTDLGNTDRSEAGNQRLGEQAMELIDQSLALERFEDADSLQRIATASFKKSKSAAQLEHAQALRRTITDAENAYKRVKKTLSTLADSPDDPGANRIAGLYYCFFKQRWESGLKMLEKCDDPRLAELAESDLLAESNSGMIVSVADGWWDLADEFENYRKPMKKRAAMWYERALPQTPAGLLRVKLEMRIKDVEKEFGT